MTPRRHVLRAALVPALVIVSACGSDEASSPTAPASEPTTTTAEQTDTTDPSTPPDSEVLVLPTRSTLDHPPLPGELDVPPPPMLCVLLTLEQVSAAIGIEVTTSEEGITVRDETPCRFFDSSGSPVFRLKRTEPDHDPLPAELLAEAEATPDAELFPDLGDGAAISEGALVVLVGDRLFTLVPIGDPLPEVPSAALVDLATIVVDGLSP